MADDETKLVEPDRRQKPPPREDSPGSQVLNADTARTAPIGKPVLWVLIASLCAAVFVLGAYLTIWSSTVP
ncbi:hypothetical protein [Phreatobacter cathodiphilus]|uniref:Uncharacterized protein n=1 Tax=Phreatobacter cathodiphilus TaxID=1868589 RepID=A0A2S0N7H6_9HYPH|nr:hypothetical protein [Phreatobacter cathodiphilus]AVO43893.1 hypothetical protein C6569_01755 [Phreatobacter cathodiphilus]